MMRNINGNAFCMFYANGGKKRMSSTLMVMDISYFIKWKYLKWQRVVKISKAKMTTVHFHAYYFSISLMENSFSTCYVDFCIVRRFNHLIRFAIRLLIGGKGRNEQNIARKIARFDYIVSFSASQFLEFVVVFFFFFFFILCFIRIGRKKGRNLNIVVPTVRWTEVHKNRETYKKTES